ncbi:arylesterase [Bordetella holmesii]|uniref:GDSL-like protein n=2 Tax=Bordetella holmesii TaxID=35814 RepID=A0A158M914_9BORD|nr:GDSL family lipase [Bordetella holmesii H558]AOB35876.1 arylesterase [Bordetella holmesii]KAK71394.1 GDSL-like protein [Bordetella holmesii H620]KAK79280.1 GDSL-like protein [Bordetella holmesii CDC-H809-BH]KAK86059.1 GDSL-like protein [Bordetella holmesii CDC-H572-BH]KAK96565.1 GDSL-like protein [Bordetella holmesii CDC-H585-BH]KAK97255.1 GDSL-like protein [Bordetella holmesii CDC-H635-BH]KCV05051.1 GDSL-like protein [Bordetella holmesii CDC-H719-BH]KCV07715.1 GDSL-like protein [Bordete
MLACVPAAQAQTASTAADRQTVLVVGDSLAAEYGLARGSGWVPLLARRLSEQYPNYQVVNASISGDTTSGGTARLPGLLKRHTPAVVVLELGSNDALRGLPLSMTENNLAAMTQAAKGAGAKVLIVGMQIPPNYGRDYTERFARVFQAVAQKEGVSLTPFLMEGMATDRELFQADGIHPNEKAQPTLLNNVWPGLKPLLRGDQPSAG